MLLGILSFICLVLSILWAAYWYREEDELGESIKVGIITFIVLELFAVAIFFMVAEIGLAHSEGEEIAVYKCDISGLELKNEDLKSLSGSFVLGCGGVRGSSSKILKYYFVSNNELGKRIENTTTDNVYIKETSDENPCYKLVYTKKSLKGFLQKLVGDYSNQELTGEVLVVPEGTIKIDYEVDL